MIQSFTKRERERERGEGLRTREKRNERKERSVFFLNENAGSEGGAAHVLVLSVALLAFGIFQ